MQDISATDSSSIDSNDKQGVDVNNNCNGGGNNVLEHRLIAYSCPQRVDSIDSNDKQESNFNNDCNGGSGTSCLVGANNRLSILATDSSSVDSNAEQEVNVNYDCDSTRCEGNTDNSLLIGATDTSVDSDTKQEGRVNNECDDTPCFSDKGNFVSIGIVLVTIESEAEQTAQTENNCVGAGCSIGALGIGINEITIDSQDSSEVDSNIHQASYGENNCDPGASCNLLDNTVEITAVGVFKVDADIDVETDGETNCPATAIHVISR